MPKLSIIIPTHNRPDRLKKAVESSVKQSYEDLEIIVVDDGSCPAANYEKMGSQVFGFVMSMLVVCPQLVIRG